MSEPVPVRSAPSQPLRVLVLGAGWLGWPLAEAFAADGARVTTVRRSAHAPVAGGQAVQADLTTLAEPPAEPEPRANVDDTGSTPPGASLRSRFGTHDVVIAAVAPDRSRGDSHASTYPAAARATAAIAAAVGARAVAWVSSTGVYGYKDGREVDEQSPRAGQGPAFDALVTAEDTVLHSRHEGPDADRVQHEVQHEVQRVVLRVAGLYGPGRDPAPRYRDATALAGRFGQWLNLAWRDDVIDAIRCWTAAALRGDDLPAVLNVADGAPITVAEAARLVAQADGRVFTPPAAGSTDAATPTRSDQRIRVYALRALGWTPAVPHLRVGLQRLGYDRLRLTGDRYGPQSALVRSLLRDLAMLQPEAHAEVIASWVRARDTDDLGRADSLLGETMLRVHREAERDAAAGPLMQMLTVEASDERDESDAPTLDPIAEPALAALMAVVVRDALPDAVYRTLTASLATAIPWLHEERPR